MKRQRSRYVSFFNRIADRNYRLGKLTWAKVVDKNPGMQDFDYPLISPLALTDPEPTN